MRATTAVVVLALAPATLAQPDQPDLGVTYVEFNPKYPAYQAE